MKNKKVLVFLGIFILILDQITKLILIDKNFSIIPNVLSFTYTENIGVAFGIGSNNLILIIISSIVLLGIILKFLKERKDQINGITLICLTLILSGGISNLIDRVFRGYVVDFIDVNLFNFPHFNIADMSIVIGITILIILIIKSMILEDSKLKEGE